MGDFLRPLRPRWGHFQFCRDSRRRRGENRGGPCDVFPACVGSSCPFLRTLDAGWLLPLFRLASAVPGGPPQRVPKLPGELDSWECPGGIPEPRHLQLRPPPREPGRDWPSETTPPSWARPRAVGLERRLEAGSRALPPAARFASRHGSSASALSPLGLPVDRRESNVCSDPAGALGV